MQSNANVTEERIRHRAYELWEQRGRPAGHDAEFWTQAEREIGLGENLTSTTANAGAARSGSGSNGSRTDVSTSGDQS